MTKFEQMRVWILGASILAYGCSGSDGNGKLFSQGLDQTAGTTTPESSEGGGKGKDQSDKGSTTGTGKSAALGAETAAPTGAERPLVSIEKAVLTANSCEPKAGSAACTACVLRNCCMETQQCFDNNSCVTLSACVSKCDDKGCVETCANRNIDGAGDYQDVLSCATSYCEAACAAQ